MSSTDEKRYHVDAAILIGLVKDRPCLWDKNDEVYPDKRLRKEAWLDIFRALDEDYDSLSREEQRNFGDRVQSKWTNLRDTFTRALRPKRRMSRKYIYHDHLSFLLKNRETAATSEIDEEEVDDGRYFDLSSSHDIPELPKEIVRCKKVKKKRVSLGNESDDLQFTSENPSVSFVEATTFADPKLFPENDDPRVMNEDEAFFASLLPTVATYSTDERLEFRMEVLSVMKRINDKKRSIDF